ncbi:MAG: FAD-linked oxidase C-terminal domain-containing protein [Bacteroidales bacterium]|nr:FAD-linked oxidase C-terminal domain-containing protein [Bacteroidales bacterium]
MNSAESTFISELKKSLNSEVHTDECRRLIYSTDASAYKEMPLGVVIPENQEELKTIIQLSSKHRVALIPRAAGTSLAGQVVGNGLVVDISRLNKIIEINSNKAYAIVEPGVVLDELNQELYQHGLMFGPETSTSNRCMMGGMVGNNSCGSHSLIYNSTREHTLSMKVWLSDGSQAEFKSISTHEFQEKLKINSLEGEIYRQIHRQLSDPAVRQEISDQFPDARLERRNTGYAVDLLSHSNCFAESGPDFNFCKLLAGSEGTLAFSYEIKIGLVPLPPKHSALLCVHLNSVKESLLANLIALKHKVVSIELMDRAILELTKENIEQRKNRFFVEGDPGAILIVEFSLDNPDHIQTESEKLIEALKEKSLGYHFPMIYGADMKKVWNLRKAGLGILSNMPGDAKPVPVIEDTAVHPEQLPDYIAEFDQMLKTLNLSCVYYAHIATGELHLRPVLNLKLEEDVIKFRKVADETAQLIKKYRGSFSGEHGDGRLRGEFIPFLVGEKNYQLFREIKQTWDPYGIFNPGKIVNTPPMDGHLRYKPGQKTREIKTYFNFDKDHGIIRAVERCNGSADCRKTEKIGGTMCPSYMATRDEKNTTRARANILREFLTTSKKSNPFDHPEIYDVLDLCLSCKACKSECPSNVDMAKLKAEFLQHYYNEHGVPLRAQLIANIHKTYKLGSYVRPLYNAVMKNQFLTNAFKQITGFAVERGMPLLSKQNLYSYYNTYKKNRPSGKKVYLFADEFTSYTEAHIGIAMITLLEKLGYEVHIPKHDISGRAYISKGLLKKTKRIAENNVALLKDIITDKTPLIGIEPSAILSFRDEYPELVDESMTKDAYLLGKNALMLEEFICREMEAGNILPQQFNTKKYKFWLHGHCQQKAIASTLSTLKALKASVEVEVIEIASGCCGMAGSFGFEKEHYDISMKVGELKLFPEVRKMEKTGLLIAPGTSCRHHILEGSGKKSLHTAEALLLIIKEL